MDNYSFLTNATPEFIENLYTDFKKNPATVDHEFRKFFEGFDFATLNYNGKSAAASFSADEFKVYNLIIAYRNKGHLIANTNPIKKRKDRKANLQLDYFGLSDKDLERKFSIGSEIGLPNAKLNEIIAKLTKTYCGTIGFEIGYVRLTDEIDFFRSRIEKNEALIKYSVQKKERILRKLNTAVSFEKFLGTKYIGEKRFRWKVVKPLFRLWMLLFIHGRCRWGRRSGNRYGASRTLECVGEHYGQNLRRNLQRV
jgi:2-oxoglutarate dehydrogenase E1 component